MIGVLWGLARTQYRELTRQPVYGVVLLIGLALVALAPALAVFALGRAEALVLDLGASSLLFFTVFLAAVAVAAGGAERLADGTTAQLLTQPISPVTCLVGTFLGSVLALAQAGLLLGIALLWAVRNGPEMLHLGVLIPAAGAMGLALIWGIRASLARQAFQPAVLDAATLLFPLAYGASLFLGSDFKPGDGVAEVPAIAVSATYLAVVAAVAFAALGVALSVRVPPAATAVLTLTAFVLASLVRGPLGEAAIGPAAWLTLALPDLQLFWIGDAAYTGTPVPPGYLVEMTLYAGLYVVSALTVGAFFLEGRELGRG